MEKTVYLEHCNKSIYINVIEPILKEIVPITYILKESLEYFKGGKFLISEDQETSTIMNTTILFSMDDIERRMIKYFKKDLDRILNKLEKSNALYSTKKDYKINKEELLCYVVYNMVISNIKIIQYILKYDLLTTVNKKELEKNISIVNFNLEVFLDLRNYARKNKKENFLYNYKSLNKILLNLKNK